jgi:DNA-binding NarL/FixJ family response regulator
MVADDHPTMREGLCALIEREPGMRVVAQASDGLGAVSQFRSHRPNLTLMDLHMPGLDGLGATAAILQEYPHALIVAVTSYGGDARIARALAIGVRSYILKTAHPNAVREALRQVLRGEIAIDSQLRKADRDALTDKEISVVKLIAQGSQNREIGSSLNVSEHTVKARIKSVLSKLGANDRAHAVTVARERGFLDF